VYSGGFIQEAAYQYRDAIIHGALSGLLLLFGIGLKPRHALVVPNALRVAAPLCGVLLLSACCSCGRARARGACRSCTRRWPI
jgi:hypothetical protein